VQPSIALRTLERPSSTFSVAFITRMGHSRLRNKNKTDLELETISSTKTWSPKPGLALVLAKEKFTRLISRLHLKITSVIYFKTRRLDRSRSNGRLKERGESN
jgi:hypothetical protein